MGKRRNPVTSIFEVSYSTEFEGQGEPSTLTQLDWYQQLIPDFPCYTYAIAFSSDRLSHHNNDTQTYPFLVLSHIVLLLVDLQSFLLLPLPRLANLDPEIRAGRIAVLPVINWLL